MVMIAHWAEGPVIQDKDGYYCIKGKLTDEDGYEPDAYISHEDEHMIRKIQLHFKRSIEDLELE